jgi:hypothetical protein
MKTKEVFVCPICNKNIDIGEEYVNFKSFGVVSQLHKKCYLNRTKKSQIGTATEPRKLIS